jgi:tetraprenyl-beta-curcumene synthase
LADRGTQTVSGAEQASWALKTVRRGRFLSRALFFALPLARRELRRREARARRIRDPAFRALALSSIRHKAFHSEGGALFAMASPPAFRRPLIRFIVAVQTISDYLDTVCDRHGALPEEPQREAYFRGIHRAFTDALTTHSERPPDADYPVRDDGYLAGLVEEAREALSQLPGARPVSPAMRSLGTLYGEFQSLKHLSRPEADHRLSQWFDGVRVSGVSPYVSGESLAALRWWEFGAAAGSTLGIFALALAAARHPDPPEDTTARTVAAYFPYICAYHILLDYFIDQQEDARGGDLNLVACYPRGTDVIARLREIREEARRSGRPLDPPDLHSLMVAGLTALYVTDPKALSQPSGERARSLLDDAGVSARILAACVRMSRAAGIFLGPPQPPPNTS